MVGEGSTCDVYCAAGDACVRECVAEPAPGVQDLIAGLVLLGCSGLFSGLTLGLMSLDPAGLEVIIAGGDPVGKSQAERILPLRKHGNLLLCSLLLGNTLVNALLAILTASFTSGLLGGVLSSAAILVFGEILPQSVCSRHGLYIGSKVVDLVRVLMALLKSAMRADEALFPEILDILDDLLPSDRVNSLRQVSAVVDR